jgi:hypothetical protein
MSRRDQLVQQNIARARSKPEAPAQQESAGKQFLGGGEGAGGPKSFFGGNFDVYSRLESIGFDKRPGGDASMRGGVAYIRIWRRGGMAASSQTTVAFSDVPSIDFQTALRTDLSSLFGPNQLTLGEDFASGFAGQSLSNTPFPTTPNLPITQSLLNRQKDLGKQTPGASPGTGLAAANIFGNQIVAQTPFTPFSLQNRFRPSPFLQSPSVFGSSAFVPTSALGNVVSANPNGLVSTLSGIALSSLLRPAGFRQSYPSYLMGPRRPSPPYLGQAQAPKTSSSGGLQGEMMWQFLFNPSELELDAGPEFKSAETWAVSDKANSGQPLHWSHNKNAQLKFNSVLLNGFVFGRKVEELEQGLIELFMARDGVGQHGPHVLEFVWGKRTFGPCVIKSIVVKEKMWDEGEVVNAELSFTLEQVPEWTINDGAYVDIARPGRQPLQEDVGRPVSGAQGATEAGTTETPGGGNGSDQKAENQQQSSTTDFTACKQLQLLSSQANGFQPIAGNMGGIFGSGYNSNFNKNNSDYRREVIDKAVSLGVTPSGECTQEGIATLYNRTVNDNSRTQVGTFTYRVPSRNEQLERADKATTERMKKCASNIETRATNFYFQKGCQRFQKNKNSTTEQL